MAKENLYFIAIIPPQEIGDLITEFKHDFERHYDSKKALKVMPHITLKAPFKLSSHSHPDLIEWFHQLKFDIGPFQTELNNFGTFDNKRHPVIFVQPVMNISLLSMQKEIVRSFHYHFPEILIEEYELKFKPHVTVAYRDLQPEQFLAAWKVYKDKEFHADFIVNDFHLLQHDGKNWNVIETYVIG